jgi:hypothetical protein
MKKLSLDLGELKVESFDTFVPEGKRGTIRANGGCLTWSCPPAGTCGAYPDSEIEKFGPAAVSFPRGNCCA